MQIQCIGLSHKTADVSLREKLSHIEHRLLEQASEIPGATPPSDIVVLSTCNRVEIYAVSDEPAFETLEQLILQNSALGQDEMERSMYTLTGMQVASHLLRVSAGLDSMVLGEPQILGQVTDAYKQALSAGTVGKILSRLFQICIHAGKRVRTETQIGRYATSIPAVAARLVSRHFTDLSDINIALLGAGEMADLALGALRKRGARHLHVMSRTLASACQLADRWQGEASTYDGLSEVLIKTNVLITSSGAPHYLVQVDMVSDAMRSRQDQPLVIIDIAVPRDVEPGVGQLPNVHLFDIDALSQDLDEGLESRRSEIARVEAILAQEYATFRRYLDSLAVVPVIVELREYSEAIRRDELEKTLRGLGDISEEQGERIRAMTHTIVNRVLHQPTVNLHAASHNNDAGPYVEAIRELFGLKGESESDPSNGREKTCPR
jgi:glutamyl-tRNA reductase